MHRQAQPAIIGSVSVARRNRNAEVTCGLVLLTFGATLARAEPPLARPAAEATFYAALGATPEARAKAEHWAQAYAGQADVTLRSVELGPDEPDAAASVSAARLEVLQDVERALVEARELSAQLREAAALRVLAHAEDTLLGALEVPGAHAFLAEVYLQLALCAAQLGEMGLFETDLARALALDPRRRVEAAEAPPAVLGRARELGRAYDLSPLSELAIRVEPAHARSTLDGLLLSSQAATQVRAGVHVLVARAAGYAPYATVLRLEPGRRAPLRVVLAPLPGELARAELAAASAELTTAAPKAKALAQRLQAHVLLFEAGHGAAKRALIYRCDEAACTLLSGIDDAAQPRFERTTAARSWLNADAVRKEPSTAPKPLWKRWPLWTAGAALVVAGVTAAIWASRGVPSHARRELEIDPPPSPP